MSNKINMMQTDEIKRLQRSIGIYYCVVCGKRLDASHNGVLDRYYSVKSENEIMCSECIIKISAIDLSIDKS